MKRHTIDFIKAQFEKYGYTLIDDIYINASTKLWCLER